MVFPSNGVVTSPKIIPSAFGLLSAISPESSVDEDRWVRGFSQEWDTELYSAKVWDDTDTTSDTVASDATPRRHVRVKPFFIEVDETLSTFGFTALDRMARITSQLEGVTQKAIELELWEGEIRRGESHENLALIASTATILNSGTAISAKRALALLEHKIGETSPCGEQGVIHMTRDVAAILASDGVVFMHGDGKDHLQTFNGTPVILGSGYTGNGPVDAANRTASDTNKWMYATGTVKVYLGKVDVVNDNLGQAYGISTNQNDMTLKAIRPAAVYFDSSIHLAVRVDLST